MTDEEIQRKAIDAALKAGLKSMPKRERGARPDPRALCAAEKYAVRINKFLSNGEGHCAHERVQAAKSGYIDGWEGRHAAGPPLPSAEKAMNDELLSQGLHEAFCIVRDYSVEERGQCNCRLRNSPAGPPESPAPPASPPPEGEIPARVREIHTDSGLRTFFYSVDSASFEMSEKLAAVENTGVDIGREYLSLFEHIHLLAEAKQQGRVEGARELANYLEDLTILSMTSEEIMWAKVHSMESPTPSKGAME